MVIDFNFSIHKDVDIMVIDFDFGRQKDVVIMVIGSVDIRIYLSHAVTFHVNKSSCLP